MAERDKEYGTRPRQADRKPKSPAALPEGAVVDTNLVASPSEARVPPVDSLAVVERNEWDEV